MGMVTIEITEEQYEFMLKTKTILESFGNPVDDEIGIIIKGAFDNHIATIEVIEKGKK